MVYGWFMVENPIKMDDLWGSHILVNLHICDYVRIYEG